MSRAAVRLSIATALSCGTLIGVEGRAQVGYDSPKGRVEILGLRHWTLAMLQDSIRHYVAGQELYDAACMVTLRDSLHFAEASVARFEMAPPGAPVQSFLTIKVIEPEDASRVQWDTHPRDEFTSPPSDYASLLLPMTDSAGNVHRGALLYWLQFGDSVGRQQAFLRAGPTARPDGERVYAFLREHRSEWDRRRAARMLRTDGFWANRMIAAAVLANFPDNDSTWWSLVRALRDPHEAVREAAGTTLRALPSRAIDWRPVAADLRLLLGGTNLPGIEDLFDLLARTRIAPDLAPALLRGNADWILDHLGIRTPMASDRAHRLLVQLNAGRDLGSTRASWASWTSSL